MVHYDNVPDKIVSASELIAKQQEMLAINGSRAQALGRALAAL